jgi:pimeloyl-ACP methyl ester carboxylesterase
MLILVIAAIVLFFVALWIPASPKVPAAAAWFTTSGGTTTASVRKPDSGNPKGTILLAHGFCENHLYFEVVSGLLADAGYTSVAINLYGYAGSQPGDKADYTVESYARQISEVASEIERDPSFPPLVAAWGHSMGAASLYQSLPNLIEAFPSLRLLVFEAPGFPEAISRFARLLIPFTALADSWLVRRFLQFWTDLFFVRKVPNPLGRRFLRRILIDYAPNRKVARQNLRSILSSKFRGVPEEWQRHGCRFYFVFARSDRLISFRRVSKKLLPALSTQGNRLQVSLMPHTDHFVSLQRPDIMARRVLHLLEVNSGQAQNQTHGSKLNSTPAS